MPQPVQLTVGDEESGMRLDSYLVRHFSKHSRVKLQRAIAAGGVLVNGGAAKSSTKLKSGQAVSFMPPEVETEGPIPEDIPLDVLYEDDAIVAINKPPAMVVHPAKGNWQGTLTSALAFHFNNLSSLGGPTRPGIVHRLDRDTSGVILVAKTDEAHLNLSKQFELRTVHKEYFAIVTPAPDRDRDVIDKPIGAHPYQREKKAIRENHSTSKNAWSYYEVVERFEGFASVKVKPKTGRTHQIRVHMAHIGSPVICDRLYSGRAAFRLQQFDRRILPEADRVVLDRQALHAHRIEFAHPLTGENMKLTAPLSRDIEGMLEVLRKYRFDC